MTRKTTPKSDQPFAGSQLSGPGGLDLFHAPVRDWFSAVFEQPTAPQILGWPAIARGETTLILAPTGTGKTLTAFLWCLDRLMLQPVPREAERCRVIYICPLKALAVDVERNLRAPLVGIAHAAQRLGRPFHEPEIVIRTGDTPQASAPAFRAILPTFSSPRRSRSICC